MPTIQERPPFVGLPPPGLRHTLCAPRRAEPAVDEQAAAAAEARRRAAAAAAEDAAIRRYLAKQAPERAPVRGGRRPSRRDGEARTCTSSCAPSTRSTPPWRDRLFRETVPPGSPPRRLDGRRRPSPANRSPLLRRPPARGTARGTQEGPVRRRVRRFLFGVLCCPVAMLLHKSASRLAASPLKVPCSSAASPRRRSVFVRVRRRCLAACKTLGFEQDLKSFRRRAVLPQAGFCALPDGGRHTSGGAGNEAAPVAVPVNEMHRAARERPYRRSAHESLPLPTMQAYAHPTGSIMRVQLADGRIIDVPVAAGTPPGRQIHFPVAAAPPQLAPAPQPPMARAGVPAMPPPPPVYAPETVTIQVPPGSAPGAVFRIKLTDGRDLDVTVPAGVQPGCTLTIAVPPRPSIGKDARWGDRGERRTRQRRAKSLICPLIICCRPELKATTFVASGP